MCDCKTPPYGQTCLSSMLDIQRISWAKKEVQEDMSYAIIRNDKLTRVYEQGLYIHNDRSSKCHLIKILNLQEHILILDVRKMN